mmetsp:Transcript_10091/g.28941  ORF Transcript_10091/g.28941 Transcript_10091/m.28941 type:complete len:225 (-) Transcript_10091:191-865(-)
MIKSSLKEEESYLVNTIQPLLKARPFPHCANAMVSHCLLARSAERACSSSSSNCSDAETIEASQGLETHDPEFCNFEVEFIISLRKPELVFSFVLQNVQHMLDGLDLDREEPKPSSFFEKAKSVLKSKKKLQNPVPADALVIQRMLDAIEIIARANRQMLQAIVKWYDENSSNTEVVESCRQRLDASLCAGGGTFSNQILFARSKLEHVLNGDKLATHKLLCVL